jgi:hypothetical protein
MEPTNDSLPDSEDNLKFENELLKLKLEIEHGMKHADMSSLSPEIENLWLNNVYNFEQQYKDARLLKIYDTIGRPDVKKLEELATENVPEALKQLLLLMEEKGIVLDCCCAYEDALLYRFITEELFEYEVEDISIEGFVRHFIYEEFYPNHDYDLRRSAKTFFENLLERKWEPEFNSYSLAKTVFYKGKTYSNEAISTIILAFQKDRTFQLEKFEIVQVNFDVQKCEGMVRTSLAYQANSKHENQFHQGYLELWFAFEFGYWYLTGFQLPETED